MYDKSGNIIDRRELLKVKVKALATEARIIRQAELKTRGELREELHRHRKDVVRAEARTTHLAYGIIRGRSVERIERPKIKRSEVLWKNVIRMIEKYGPTDKAQKEIYIALCKE